MSAVKRNEDPCADAARSSGAERLTRLIHWAGHAGRRLRRVLAECVAPWELSEQEFLLLWLCSQERDGLGQGELATALGVSPAQMSTVVERLRKRDLIAVERSTSDRRRQVWQIAAAGAELLAKANVTLETLAQRIEIETLTGERFASEDFLRRLAEVSAEVPALKLFHPDSASASCDR